MLLWRICRRAEGERAFEGTEARGTSLIHASGSRALAVLEHAARAEDGDEDLVLVAGELPDDVSRESLGPEVPPELQRLVSEWAASGRSAVLSVPSSLVPGDRDVLVNPAHPESAALLVRAVEPFRLDPRLVRRRAGGSGHSLPAIADGSERRLDPKIVRVQRIGGLIAVAVVAGVFLAGIAVASFVRGFTPALLGTALAAWTLFVAVLAAAAIAWPPLAWARTSFRADGDGLEIRRGVWWREVLRVPRSRVQHTDVSQGPVERSFGLSTLVVHTAGTRHAAIQLEGLDLPTAETLRDFLIAGVEDAV